MKRLLLLLSLSCIAQINAQVCFSPPTYYNGGINPVSLITADFNGDGYSDIAIPGGYTPAWQIAIYLSDGNGNLVPCTTLPFSAYVGGLTAGDFNSDGMPDLATVIGSSNVITLFLNTGSGSFFGAATTFTCSFNAGGLVSADFNGDGKDDLASATGGASGIVKILLGTGTGTFGAPISSTLGSYPGQLNITDLNADGNVDLAFANYYAGYVSVLLGTGTGAFAPRDSFFVGNNANVITSDLNGDLKPDLAIAHSPDTITVMLGTGTGTFIFQTSFTVTGNFTLEGAADLDGDSKADLVAISSSNQIAVLTGTGTGNFGAPVNFVVGFTPTSNPSSIVIGEFNADTKPDLAIADAGINRLAVLINGQSVGITGLETICSGSNTTLTASGANTYTWSPNAGSANTATITIAPLVNTTYTVTSDSTAGCTYFSQVVTVTVNPIPSVTIASNVNPLCAGNTATLTAIGAGWYNWNTGATTTSISITPSVSTTYTVIGTDTNNCKDTSTFTQNVINCSTPCAAVTDSIYADVVPHTWDAVPNYSSYVTSATWSWGDGTFSTGLYPSHTYTAAGWYNVCVTAYSSCGDSATSCLNDSLYKMANNASTSMVYFNVLSQATSMAQNAFNNQIAVYPNPTSNQFFIEANTNDKLTVDLYDVNGRHVFNTSVSDKENINVSTLDNGAYTLTIKTAGRVLNKKLVILR